MVSQIGQLGTMTQSSLYAHEMLKYQRCSPLGIEIEIWALSEFTEARTYMRNITTYPRGIFYQHIFFEPFEPADGAPLSIATHGSPLAVNTAR